MRLSAANFHQGPVSRRQPADLRGQSSGCRAVYTDDSTGPGGGTGQLLFRGCWGTAPFDPTEGGDCAPLDAESCSRHDDCIAIYVDQLGPNDAVVSTSFERCAAELSPTP